MTQGVVPCPRCRAPADARAVIGGTLTCAICAHRWSPAVSTMTTSGGTLNSTALSAAARQPSGEYLPDETPVGALKALTTRHDSHASVPPRPAVVVRHSDARAPSDMALPAIDPAIVRGVEVARPATTSRHRQRPPLFPEPSVPEPTAPDATGEASGNFDADLFDRLENEAQSARARLNTVAELTFDTPGSGRLPVTAWAGCPVCGHSFTAVTGGGQQRCPQCGTGFDQLSGKLEPADGRRAEGGDQLIGRQLRGCLIDRKIGEGGMGAVYHARQLSLDRSVAVKVLPAELARNRNFISRFEREAKSLARINHPNILHIYDFGEEPAIGVYFMVIEFVDGRDLGDILNRRGTLAELEVLDLIRQAAMGLQRAAEAGVIHRDIKPDNLLLGPDGVCKVSDFGLAKGYGAQTEVTGIGIRVGTPAFMSPEQCDGVEVDFRSDVYNLGCTAYLCLTGRLPFDGETPFAIMLKHKTEAVPSLRQYVAVDARTDALIGRMLAKRPTERCDSWKELVQELEQLMRDLAPGVAMRKTHGPLQALPAQPAPGAPSAMHHPATITSVGQIDMPDGPNEGRAADMAVPEWLRPVDDRPLVASASSTPPAAMPTPATDQAPPPGTTRPLRTSRRLEVELGLARERGREHEAAARTASGDRLAAAGQHDDAAAEWDAAAALLADDQRSTELQARAVAAKQAGRRRRVGRSVLVLAATLAVLAGLAWAVPPLVHNFLADRELAAVSAINDERQRLPALKRLVAERGAPWAWYTAMFRRGYEITAVTAAQSQIAASSVTTAAGSSAVLRPVADLDELERAAADPRVDWATVVRQAEALATRVSGPAVLRVAQLRALASEQLRAQTTLIEKIETLVASGAHGAALDAATAFRRDQQRAGELTARLPLPGRLTLSGDRPVTEASVRIDGVALTPVGERRFCRSAIRAVVVEADVEGLSPVKTTVPAAATVDEQTVALHLRTKPAWSTSLGGGAAWTAMQAVGEGVLVQRADGLWLLDAATGAVRATFPQAPVAEPLALTRDGTQMLAGAAGGQLLRLETATLTVADTPWRGRGVVLAAVSYEPVLRPGQHALALVEQVGGNRNVVVAIDGVERWRLNALDAGGVVSGQPTWLAHRDERLVVLTDGALRTVDEDGGDGQTAALPAPRTGAPVLLDAAGLLLVPTTLGIEAIHLKGADALRPLPDAQLAALGPARLSSDGDQVLAARGDRGLDLLRWDGNAFAVVWSVDAEQRFATAPALAADSAVTADSAGTLTVRGRADGRVQARISHGTPLATTPLVAGGQVTVIDVNGSVSSYRLP